MTPRKSYRALGRRIFGITTGAIVLIAVISTASLIQDRKSTLEAAADHAQNLARNLAEHTARSLDAVDLALLTVKKQAERDRAYRTRPAADINAEILEFVTTLPQMRGMIITDKEGIIRYTERKKSIGMDIHNRGYFRHHMENPESGLYVGKPLIGRTTGRWFFSTSRRINDPKGGFAGITMALVTQGYFKDIYERAEREQNVSSAYVTRDGLIFAASSGFAPAGEDVSGQTIRYRHPAASSNASSGMQTTKLFPAGAERIVAYAAVPGAPIDIVSTITIADALTTWYRRATYLTLLNIAALIVLVGLTFAVRRHLRQLANAESQLRTSERRFRDVVETATDWIWETDANHRISYLSERYAEVVGIDLDFIIGRTRAELADPQTDEERVLWHRHRVMIDNHESFRDFRYHLRLPNGQEFDFAVSGKPRFDEDGKFLGYVGTGTNITAEIRAEAENKELEARLRHTHKMETVGALAGGVAHDFNNLIGIIIGNIETVKDSIRGNDRIAEASQSIERAAWRASELTKRLLAFSRESTESASPIDANKVLSELENFLKRSLTAEIDIEMHFSERLWLTLIDPSELENAVINLAVNARHAMPDSGRFMLETENKSIDREYAAANPGLNPGDYVMITVTDSGTGMDEDTQERIFEPFFSTRSKDEGTGLGLSMVYGFVRRSGGHVIVKSSLGEGTSFRIFLPATARTQTADDDDSLDAATLPMGNEAILVVEDETDLADYVRRTLSKLGYRVRVAENGSRALELLRAGMMFDLIFTDLVMPGGVSGLDLADEASVLLPRAKILLTTGFAGNIRDDGSHEALLAAIVAKPYRRGELAMRIRQALDDPGRATGPGDAARPETVAAARA